VVHNQIDNHSQPTIGRLPSELHKIAQRSQLRINTVVVSNVIAIVSMRRWVKRHQPDAIDAQTSNVIEAIDQPDKVSNSVSVSIHVHFDIEAVDDGIFVPQVYHDGFSVMAVTSYRYRLLLQHLSTGAFAATHPAANDLTLRRGFRLRSTHALLNPLHIRVLSAVAAGVLSAVEAGVLSAVEA
jgi:hypothetical protein